MESGRIAVSDDHLATLKKQFTAPAFNPSFAEFLKGLEQGERPHDALALVLASRYLILAVWRWQEGLDLASVPSGDQVTGFVTVPASDRATLAFEMTGSTNHWKKGDVLVFSECKPFELRASEPCVIQYTRERRSRTCFGLAEPKGTTIEVKNERRKVHSIPKDSIIISFREELRISRADRS